MKNTMLVGCGVENAVLFSIGRSFIERGNEVCWL